MNDYVATCLSCRTAQREIVIVTSSFHTKFLTTQDKNVNQLQSILQELSIFGQEIFAFIITLLTTKICVAENENEFSYIRIVLKVFVLYFIITSDFAWMCDSRAAYIERQTEIMSEIIFFPSWVSSLLNADSSENCLWLTTLRKKISRREHCCFEIIKMIVELINVMPLQ